MRSYQHLIARAAATAAIVFSLTAEPRVSRAEIDLTNPDWNITLTDFGYSDLLFDDAPGFVGREYLSGEWAAAISYSQDANSHTPTWLEPQFVFPDWTTNSDFSVISPAAVTGFNADGLPIAESTIANNEVSIHQTFEMIDTVTGVEIGRSPASLGGAGASRASNQYAMRHTYSITNTTEADITDLAIFQFLHSLEATEALYDDRDYGGAFGEYRHDITQTGDTGGFFGSSGFSLVDLVSFHVEDVPDNYEVGFYGSIQAGDDHDIGKPSVGTHFSVEADALDNTDSFTPDDLWVSGAQKVSLGTLGPDESVSFDTLLAISTTASLYVTGGPTYGLFHIQDRTDHHGGFDFSLARAVEIEVASVTAPGRLLGTFDALDPAGVAQRVTDGDFTTPDFNYGDVMQLWDLVFEGEFDGLAQLYFYYDPALLPEGTAEHLLAIFHFNGLEWVALPGTVDVTEDYIAVETDSLSPFALGIFVPEPATIVMLGVGSLLLARRIRL